jgi:hypothetical protein
VYFAGAMKGNGGNDSSSAADLYYPPDK